jgi:catechol 2,3-dioxygenase-like lactoylglutathione lyase family enzyme
MQVRLARHTNRLTEIVRFYRDGLGLREIGHFKDHDGYDGIFLALTGTETHLEFTTGGEHRGPTPHPDSLLVLYLGSLDAVSEACERVGAQPVDRTDPRKRSAHAARRRSGPCCAGRRRSRSRRCLGEAPARCLW